MRARRTIAPTPPPHSPLTLPDPGMLERTPSNTDHDRMVGGLLDASRERLPPRASRATIDRPVDGLAAAVARVVNRMEKAERLSVRRL